MPHRRKHRSPVAAEMASGRFPSAPSDTPVREAAQLLDRSGRDTLAVVGAPGGRGRIRGILPRRMLDLAIRHGLGSHRVGEFLLDPPPAVPADAGPGEVAAAVARHGAALVETAEDAGARPGIVTAAELAAHLAAQQERVGADLRDRMIRGIPAPLRAALRRVGRSAARRRERAWLVGGSVRDLFLGREPRDLDVTVEGDACALAREVAAALGTSAAVHAPFGTATLELASGTVVDLATARSEFYRRPAALPEVTPAGIRQDLFRRDFTINALAVRLDPERFGTLLDLFGGLADLRARRIRVLHGLSFVEDPTRAFRAVRFASRLRFSLSPATAHLARQAAREGLPDLLSAARLRREVETLFFEERSASCVRLLASLGLLQAIHPSLRADRVTTIRLRRANRVLDWHRRTFPEQPCREWLVRLGVAAASLDLSKQRELANRLRPPRFARRFLEEAPAEARRIARALLGGHEVAPSKIHACCRNLPVETLLLAAALSPRTEVARAVRRFLTRLRTVRLSVSGRDLLRVGVPPGPGVARGLEAALRARLDGRARTKREELDAALAALRRDHGA